MRARPAVEVNFVDPFVRKGYRIAGTARIIERDTPQFAELAPQFAEYADLASRMRAIVRIGLSKALPITSPAYDLGAVEAGLRRIWTTRFRKLQPSARFEE